MHRWALTVGTLMGRIFGRMMLNLQDLSVNPPPIALLAEERPPHSSPNDTNHPFFISASYEDESIALYPPRQWPQKRQLFQLMTLLASVFGMCPNLLILFLALVFTGTLETSLSVHSISRGFGSESRWVSLLCSSVSAWCTLHEFLLVDDLWVSRSLNFYHSLNSCR